MLEHRLWSIVIVFFAHGTSKTIEVAPISLASPELSLEFLQCNYCNRFRYAEYRNRYVERQISHQRMRTARLIRSTRRLSEKSGQTEVFFELVNLLFACGLFVSNCARDFQFLQFVIKVCRQQLFVCRIECARCDDAGRKWKWKFQCC